MKTLIGPHSGFSDGAWHSGNKAMQTLYSTTRAVDLAILDCLAANPYTPSIWALIESRFPLDVIRLRVDALIQARLIEYKVHVWDSRSGWILRPTPWRTRLWRWIKEIVG